MKRWLSLFVVLMMCCMHFAQAAVDDYQFASAEQERVFRELITELRCPQCQNNNIAESNATISADMRAKVYELLTQNGYTKEQVVDYMVARYGNFVTYDPPVTSGTLILWLLPALALLAGIAFLIYRSRVAVTDSENDVSSSETLANDDGSSTAISQEQQIQVTASAPRMFWVYVIAFLAVFSVASYWQIGSWDQVRNLREVQSALPELRERAFDPRDNLSVHEMSLLALGLRSSLTQDSDNLADWMLLGSVYLALQNYGEASQAVTRAYAIDPNDPFVKSKYAQFLVYSDLPIDVLNGERLLREVIAQDPTDIEAISALAFSAFTQHRYEEAIKLWEYQLQVLPRNHSSRMTIERSIARARAEYEQFSTQQSIDRE